MCAAEPAEAHVTGTRCSSVFVAWHLSLFCFVSLLCGCFSVAQAAIVVEGDLNPVYNGVDDPWVLPGELVVADTAYGKMVINGGSSVTDRDGYIAGRITAAGHVTVRGSGSQWINENWLVVGDDWNAWLTIENGGYVSSRFGYVGMGYGGAGYVTIRGAGSLWECSGNITQNAGRLLIEQGAVVSAGGLSIDKGYSQQGSVIVTGPGSRMDLHGLSVGYYTSSTLAIQKQAVVNVTGDTSLLSSMWDWGHGQVLLQNGTLNTGGLLLTPDGLLGVGTVNAKGLVSDFDLIFDADTGLQQQFLINNLPGQAITLNLDVSDPNNTAMMGAGVYDQGRLCIYDGLTISSGFGYLGYYEESQGLAFVSGPGSTWITHNSLAIGVHGGGILNVNNGGTVNASNRVTLGSNDWASGSIKVYGDGSLLSIDGGIDVGIFGEGEMKIESGGTVINNDANIAKQPGSTGSVLVSGLGSTWTNQGYLIIGKNYSGHGDEQPSSGTLTIEEGGQVFSQNSTIAPTANTLEIIVTVSGAGSSWVNDNTLIVGYSGIGVLRIEDGGHVISGDIQVGYHSQGSGFVTVSGAGSSLVATDSLYLGGGESSAGGQATLSLEQGGLVRVTDTLKLWNGATLNGYGQIIADHLINQGRIEPGLNAIGDLTITGDYTQEDQGVLAIELADDGFDRLFIVGQVTLGGNMEVVFDEGFTPVIGDSFIVLTSTEQIAGSFSQVTVPFGIDVVYASDSITLLYRHHVDLNSDGFVNLDDLDVVLTNWNQQAPAGSWAHGDFSGDGFVGLDDLDIILSNWNTGTPPASVPAGIPEPSIPTIVILSGLVTAIQRQRL